MRAYFLVLVFVLFSSCKFTTKKSSSELNTFNFHNNLYEFRGAYPKNNMIECPDFVRFLDDDKYYVLNDCAVRVIDDPRIDTISETGKYKYFKHLNKLLFFDRKLITIRSGQIFDTDLDTIKLEVVRISKDTLIFKENKILVYFSKVE